MDVAGAATTSYLKRKLWNVFSNITYSPSHRQTGAPTINIQSTLRTAPDWCKNVPLAALFGSNGNSFTISVQTGMCICVHVLNNIEKVFGQENRKKKIGEILDLKLSPCSGCCMLSSVYFPGVWILYADVSKHSVCSIFIGR